MRTQTETKGSRLVDYKEPLTPEAIAAKKHRVRAGGKWDRMAKLQISFMKEQGLLPEHHFLDVGCGPLRAGRRFIDYLEPGHYYGIDINETLLDVGYNQELKPRLRKKMPWKNLQAVDRFECDMFGVEFDYAIAQSVFTHVSLNLVRLCLHQVSKVVKPGGRFFATFFEATPDQPLDTVLPTPGQGLRQDGPHPWYYADDLKWASTFGAWEFRYIGEWNHPANQRMVEFTRTAA